MFARFVFWQSGFMCHPPCSFELHAVSAAKHRFQPTDAPRSEQEVQNSEGALAADMHHWPNTQIRYH